MNSEKISKETVPWSDKLAMTLVTLSMSKGAQDMVLLSLSLQ